MLTASTPGYDGHLSFARVAACARRESVRSEWIANLEAFLPSRALPHDTGKSLERTERFTCVSPLLQLLYGNMIAGLATGAVPEKRARYVYHMRRMCPLVKQWRTAPRAEASHRPGRLIFEAGDSRRAVSDAEPTAPTAHVCGVGGAVRASTRTGMIVPSPARREINLKSHLATETLARHACRGCRLRLPGCSCLAHIGPHLSKQPIPRSSRRF
jgi:hypothetical protein